MVEKVMKIGIKKDKRYFYFVDKQGDISRARLLWSFKKCKLCRGCDKDVIK